MVLHNATAAGGHGACPAMKPLANKCISKGGPPPKVARKRAGQGQSCFDFANESPTLSQDSSAAGSVDFQNDTSSITPQQRYAWKHALNLPIGYEGSPPAEVRQNYLKAPTPKTRAAIVNHFVPKDVSYRHIIKFEQSRLHKFLERFVEHKESMRAEGYTFTELRSILGYGNLENGTIALEEGLACGDIQKKRQKYYMARHSISKKEHWREGYGFDSFAKDADHEKWQKIASELMPHDWAQFALLGKRLLPLKDGKKHSKIKPA